jgi:UDP-2,3-diacylglucosamine pyrophosphatase LpxH
MTPTTIQYASDLHLDHFPGLKAEEFDTFLSPSAPILVLAGDIASAWHPIYPTFIAWVSRRWKHVILIAGNHEYHCEPTQPQSRHDTDRRIMAICWKHSNLHFLQNGAAFYLPKRKIVFIGTTLYSDINPAIHDEIRYKSDFRNSYSESLRLATPADFVRLHAQQKQALGDAIRSVNRGYKVIVVTHYMPTMNLLEPEYRYEAWRSCYASNDDDLIRSPVSLWICGHSHRQTIYTTKKGIQLAMNARGYNKPHELERTADKYSKYGRVVLKYV